MVYNVGHIQKTCNHTFIFEFPSIFLYKIQKDFIKIII